MLNKFDKFRNFIKMVLPDVTDEDIQIFIAKQSYGEFEKGRLFIREEEICDRLLFIHKGVFRYYLLHEGKEYVKDFAVDVQNPFCTSYTSFMLNKPSEIWIEAALQSHVSIFKKEDVLPLFQNHPTWTKFAKLMVDKLFYRKEQKEIEFLKCSAEVRYQHFLANYPGLFQRIPQYHIASYLGITPESLSRIRSKLGS